MEEADLHWDIGGPQRSSPGIWGGGSARSCLCWEVPGLLGQSLPRPRRPWGSIEFKPFKDSPEQLCNCDVVSLFFQELFIVVNIMLVPSFTMAFILRLTLLYRCGLENLSRKFKLLTLFKDPSEVKIQFVHYFI